MHEDMNRALSESETASELRRTKAELAKAIVSIKAFQAQLCAIRKEKFGKRMMGRNYEVNTEDFLVMTHLGKLLHTGFWKFHKFLQKGWGDCSDKEGSVCYYIFQNVELPANYDKPTYWILVLKPCINKKYIVMRANFEEQIRKQQNCKHKPIRIQFKENALSNKKLFVFFR